MTLRNLRWSARAHLNAWEMPLRRELGWRLGLGAAMLVLTVGLFAGGAPFNPALLLTLALGMIGTATALSRLYSQPRARRVRASLGYLLKDPRCCQEVNRWDGIELGLFVVQFIGLWGLPVLTAMWAVLVGISLHLSHALVVTIAWGIAILSGTLAYMLLKTKSSEKAEDPYLTPWPRPSAQQWTALTTLFPDEMATTDCFWTKAQDDNLRQEIFDCWCSAYQNRDTPKLVALMPWLPSSWACDAITELISWRGYRLLGDLLPHLPEAWSRCPATGDEPVLFQIFNQKLYSIAADPILDWLEPHFGPSAWKVSPAVWQSLLNRCLRDHAHERLKTSTWSRWIALLDGEQYRIDWIQNPSWWPRNVTLQDLPAWMDHPILRLGLMLNYAKYYPSLQLAIQTEAIQGPAEHRHRWRAEIAPYLSTCPSLVKVLDPIIAQTTLAEQEQWQVYTAMQDWPLTRIAQRKATLDQRPANPGTSRRTRV